MTVVVIVVVPGSVRGVTRSRCTRVLVSLPVVLQPLHDGSENLNLTMCQAKSVVRYVPNK